MNDRFYLTDDIYIHGNIRNKDELILTDEITHFSTILKPDEFLKLVDEVMIKKDINIDTEFSLYDDTKIIKTMIQRSSNMKLRDECFVVRN